MQDDYYYPMSDSLWLRPFLSNKFIALSIHWLFQGLLYTDATERFYKVGLDLALFSIIGATARQWLSLPAAIVLGALGAHTLNFLFNAHVWAVLKHFGNIQHTQAEFDAEVERMRRRIAREPSIRYAAAYGSLARGEWSPTSDLDVRLVREPGLDSALRVCLFAMLERARSFVKGFPLDIFVFDHYDSLNKMSEKSFPVVLTAPETKGGDQCTGVIC